MRPMTPLALFNGICMGPRPTGISVTARELAIRLPPDQVPVLDPCGNSGPHGIPISSDLCAEHSARGHLERLLWTQNQLPDILKRWGNPLLFSPLPEAPLMRGVRSVVLVHDLIPRRFPQGATKQLRAYHTIYIPMVLHSAKLVLCNSVATAKEVHECLKIPTSKIVPIKLGFDAGRLRPLHLERRHELLVLGRHAPHKNLERLLQAFAQVRDKSLRLRLLGPEHRRFTQPLKDLADQLGIASRCMFQGWAGEEEKLQCLHQARALILPSLWEGFGLPALEAMACGTPVLASNAGAIPEVVGDGALLFDPQRVEAITGAIDDFLNDSHLEKTLQQAGPQQARHFHWSESADQVLELLKYANAAHPRAIESTSIILAKGKLAVKQLVKSYAKHGRIKRLADNGVTTVSAASVKANLSPTSMKILLINDLSPDADCVGGTERYMVDIALELAKIGCNVHTFTLSADYKEASINNSKLFHARPPLLSHTIEQQTSVKNYVFHEVNTYFRKIFFYKDLYQQLRNLIKNIRPDIIHLQNNYKYPITILLALWGQKVVQTIHDYTVIYPTTMCTHRISCADKSVTMALQHGCITWQKLIATGWFRYNRRFVDRLVVSQFIAPSKDLTLSLKKRGYGNVIHLKNFTRLTAVTSADTMPITSTPALSCSNSLAAYSTCGQSLSQFSSGTISKNKHRIILYVGQLVNHKGVNILLHAYAMIQLKLKDISLWIVGDGPAKNHLGKLAKQLDLCNVVFLGKLNHSDLSPVYHQARVVVIPSLWFENAPLVAYEAMAHGCPILATRIGGLPELVTDGKNGYLFERGNAAELAQKMSMILMDDDLAQSLGNGSQDKLSTMDTAAVHAQSLVRIYASKLSSLAE